MNTIYPVSITVNTRNEKFSIAFISTRAAKLILKKSLSGEWEKTQIAAAPILNMFGFAGYVPAFTSPTVKSILFIKHKPGLFKAVQAA